MISELFRLSPWTATATLALAAVLAALVVRRVAVAILLRATAPAPLMHSVVVSAQRPAGALLPLLALQAVWQLAPVGMRFIAGVQHVNGLLLIACFTWMTMAVIAGVAQGIIDLHPVSVEDNLNARRIHTQARVLARSAMVVALIAGTSMALMTFPGARQVGASLLASAGVIGIVAGIAARPVFSNLIAGLQLALAQPIRLDDVLIVEGEWGRVEEIKGTYVVLKIWDERRLVIPLQWFIENPFQNWTRTSARIHQSIFLHLDFATQLDPLRAELRRVVEGAAEWDGRTAQIVVTDTTERTMKVRVLVSAGAAGPAFDLGCKVREALIAFIAREYPESLPRARWAGVAPAQGQNDRGMAVSPQ